MARSQAFWILICIAVIGVALRSYNITDRSLWFDEAFSWRLIQFPFQEMIARDALDVHPPLYYIFLKGWGVVFGTSLLAIRSFSVACAGVSLLTAYLYAAYAFRSRLAGLYAAVFLAVSPWCISYAWEARMYPLGMVFALGSSYALLRAVREKSFVWFSVYAVAAAALAYTHYYGLFTIAAQALFVLVVLVKATKWRIGEMFQSRLFWAACGSLLLGLALFAPWLSTFLQQRSQVQESFWVPPVSFLGVTHTFYRLFAPTLHVPELYGVFAIPLIATILFFLYIVLRYKKMDGVWLTSALGVVPITLSILASLGGRSLYNDRFLAFSGIFIFVLCAYAVSAIRKAMVRRVLFGLIVVGLVCSFVLYWNELDVAHKGGARVASAHLFTSRTGSEPVLVSSPFVYFSILYYAKEEFSLQNVPHLYSQEGEISHFSGAPILIKEDIVGPQDIAAYTGTVWVVDTTGFSGQPFEAPTHWREVSHEVFPEVFVYQGDIIVRKFLVVPR